MLKLCLENTDMILEDRSSRVWTKGLKGQEEKNKNKKPTTIEYTSVRV